MHQDDVKMVNGKFLFTFCDRVAINGNFIESSNTDSWIKIGSTEDMHNSSMNARFVNVVKCCEGSDFKVGDVVAVQNLMWTRSFPVNGVDHNISDAGMVIAVVKDGQVVPALGYIEVFKNDVATYVGDIRIVSTKKPDDCGMDGHLMKATAETATDFIGVDKESTVKVATYRGVERYYVSKEAVLFKTSAGSYEAGQDQLVFTYTDKIGVNGEFIDYDSNGFRIGTDNIEAKAYHKPRLVNVVAFDGNEHGQQAVVDKPNKAFRFNVNGETVFVAKNENILLFIEKT